MKSRADRRRRDRLQKRRTAEKIKIWDRGADFGREPLVNDPKFVGKMAAVHCRGCSCWMCKYESGKPEVKDRVDDES